MCQPCCRCLLPLVPINCLGADLAPSKTSMCSCLLCKYRSSPTGYILLTRYSSLTGPPLNLTVQPPPPRDRPGCTRPRPFTSSNLCSVTQKTPLSCNNPQHQIHSSRLKPEKSKVLEGRESDIIIVIAWRETGRSLHKRCVCRVIYKHVRRQKVEHCFGEGRVILTPSGLYDDTTSLRGCSVFR